MENPPSINRIQDYNEINEEERKKELEARKKADENQRKQILGITGNVNRGGKLRKSRKLRKSIKPRKSKKHRRSHRR
jgi:hypothetical protein